MEITRALLVSVFGDTSVDEAAWAPAIDYCCHAYDIVTAKRVAAFLAQVGHESGRLRYAEEIWGPTPQQLRYERDFTQEWSLKNERNKLAFALGNAVAGDGHKYKGRGLLQVTGHNNTVAFRNRMIIKFGSTVPDFEANPSQLALKTWAALSAGDFWNSHRLNGYADEGRFKEMTKIINGGYNGLAEREALYVKALKVLGA